MGGGGIDWRRTGLLVLSCINLLLAGGAQARGLAVLSLDKPAIPSGNSAPLAETSAAPERLLIALPAPAASNAAAKARSLSADFGHAIAKPFYLPNQDFDMAVKRPRSSIVEYAVPGRGIYARLNFASGNDVMLPGQHVLGGTLTAANSWRRDVGATLAVPQPESVGLAVSVGAYSGRRPTLGGDGTRHGVGEFSRWRESRSWDLGVKIDLPDSGLRYSGGISRSQYSFQKATRNDNQERLLSGRPRWRSGGSQWSRIDADLWKNNSGEATAYAFYGTMGTDFRNYRSGYDTPLIFDGSTFEAGGELRYRGSRMSFKSSTSQGSDLGLTENSVRLKTGPVDLWLESGSWAFRDSALPDWWMKDSYWKSRLRLSLTNALGGGFGKGVLPGEATFRFESTRSTSSSALTPADKERRKFGFGVAWSGSNRTAEVSLSRVVTNRPASFAAGPSRAESIAVDFNRTRSGDDWEFSYYGSIGSQNSPFSSDRNVSGGVEFSLTGKNRPKLSLGVDYNRFDLRSYQLGYRDTEFSVNAKLDLSQYMPPTRTGQKPYLILKAYGDWSKNHVTGERDNSQLDPTVMLVFGTRF